MTGTIDLKITAPIATISLNAPARHNAISEAMWAGLPELIAAVNNDETVRVVIFTGAGKAFAAGANISEFETAYATASSAADYARLIATAMSALATCPKPVLAKISGPCVGGGCALALCCDIRFADSSAKFAIPPARLGLAYTLEDTKRLVDAVGQSRAKDLTFTGRLIKAEEAKEINLVDFLYKEDQLDDAVSAYAKTLAGNSQTSLNTIKQTLHLIENGTTKDTPATRQSFAAAFDSDDFRIGYKAFLAKKPPKF